MNFDEWIKQYDPGIKFLDAIRTYLKQTDEKRQRAMRRREVYVRSRSKWISRGKNEKAKP